MSNTSWTLLTPPHQGAISIVQLSGEVTKALSSLTDRDSWEDGTLHLVELPDIDEAIAVKLNDRLAHLMPHGGTQILRKLVARFDELDIKQEQNPQFPEAEDAIEAAMMHTLSIAESPLAVELLLKQPQKLRGATATEEDKRRSAILDHFVSPPIVVLLGEPNTGKSTLMNALTRQDTSIVHEIAGATRDAVGARVNCAGLVIDLYDLPGFRTSEDSIEQEAIRLATKIASTASLTIQVTDAEHDWVSTTCNTSFRVATKSDLATRSDADLNVSAMYGDCMQELCVAIRDAIVPSEVVNHDGPWFFEGLDGYSPIAE